MPMLDTSTPTQHTARASRLLPLCGPAFVVSALVGNSLTESGEPHGSELDLLAAKAASAAFRVGVLLEIAGLAAFALFVAWLLTALLRHRTLGLAGVTVPVAGILAVSVKLTSGAALLGGVHQHHRLDQSAAVALTAANGVGFELFWVGFGMFVCATAFAAASRGWVSPIMRATGAGLGVLTVAFGALGAVMPELAVPIPFLLCLVWVVGFAVKMAVRRPA